MSSSKLTASVLHQKHSTPCDGTPTESRSSDASRKVSLITKTKPQLNRSVLRVTPAPGLCTEWKRSPTRNPGQEARRRSRRWPVEGYRPADGCRGRLAHSCLPSLRPRDRLSFCITEPAGRGAGVKLSQTSGTCTAHPEEPHASALSETGCGPTPTAVDGAGAGVSQALLYGGDRAHTRGAGAHAAGSLLGGVFPCLGARVPGKSPRLGQLDSCPRLSGPMSPRAGHSVARKLPGTECR